MHFLWLLIASILQKICAFPSFQVQIPNGAEVEVDGELWPGVGHLLRSGGGDLNPFGLDFQDAGSKWTSALCEKDSDGDGLSNGYELGDPSCRWTPGAQPERAVDITNPGISNALKIVEVATGVLGAPLWYDWHAFLMLISWIIVIPAGVLFPVLMKDSGTVMKAAKEEAQDSSSTAPPSDDQSEDLKLKVTSTPWWLQLHRGFTLLGAALFIAGFVVAFKSKAGSHFQSRHAQLGLSVVVLGLVQLVGGLFRPHKPTAIEQKSQLRRIWEYIHPWLGRSCVVLALSAAITGFSDQLAPIVGDGGAIAGIASVGAIIASWALLIIAYKFVVHRKSRRHHIESDDSSS